MYCTNNLLQILDWCPPDSNSILLHALHELSTKSDCQPTCFMLPDVRLQTGQASGGGGFGEVWQETIKGHKMAIKIIRNYESSDVEKINKVL